MKETTVTVSANSRQLEEVLNLSPASTDPASPEALHMAGLRALGQGDAARAVTLLEQASRTSPLDGIFHLNLGNAYLASRQGARAADCFRRALELMPASAEARYNLGLACLLEQAWLAALQCFREALRFDPHHLQAIHALGFACEKLDRPSDAAACYQELVSRAPDHLAGWNSLASTLIQQGEYTDAELALARALALNPGNPQTHLHRGLLFLQQGALDLAETGFRQSLAVQPDSVDAWCNLSSCLLRQGRGEDAGQAALEALRRCPEHAGARSNFAFSMRLQGRLDTAITCYRDAITLAPDDPQLHWNLALALLASGDWRDGWPEYRWRFRAGITEPRSCSQPLWNGDPSDRRILVWAEQGLGDTIHFLRYLPRVRERAAHVILEAQDRLIPLLSHCPLLEGIDVRGRGTSLPGYDAHLPLLSLAELFTPTPQDIPWPGAYLTVPPDRLALWRQRLAAFHGRRIGLCWAGNPGHKNDAFRSLASDEAAPLAAVPGVTFFSLQRDILPTPAGVHVLLHPDQDVLDTAALIANLDLIITVDTLVAHLAGALGKPAWLLLGRLPDWRWLADSKSTPWYPSLRLWRCLPSQSWPAVIAEVAAALV